MSKILGFAKKVPMLWVVLVCGLVMGLLWHPYRQAAQWLVAVLVAVSLVDTLKGMIDDVRHGHVGVDILAVVAILSTLAVKQYWASWAVVLMLYSGDAIEQYAGNRAQNNLTVLVQAAPQVAHVVQSELPEGEHALPKESDWSTVAVDKVRLNDLLVVKPGETVPVDGELISRTATLDMSTINGEPMPRRLYQDAQVMSGAVNGSGTFLMRARQLARDSQYQRILNLVRSAQNSRAAVVRTADLMAVPFTVVAFIIACVAWIISGVPTRFAQVLVLATPCPLLIAAPVAYMAGTGRLAKAGLLIKTQDVIENLGRVSHIFFDKTGTLTVKRPQVAKIDLPEGREQKVDTDRILAIAGAVEAYSVHILANGIAEAGAAAQERLRAQSSDEIHLHAREVREDSGNGIQGMVDGHQVKVGRAQFVADGHSSDSFGPLAPDEMASYISIDGVLAARIVMKDVPRSDAAQTIAQLRELGITRLSMVTGDKEASARIIADQVGITDVHAGLFPEDKADLIAKASKEEPNRQPLWDIWLSKFLGESVTKSITVMVGDGVNDAPVLAAADVGMAITDGTTTAASESAQAVIMNDDIACLPRSITIARRTKRVMLQAVMLGLTLATVGMLCAAFDLIPVVVGAFTQEAIDVVSILWALTALIDRD
ncbi:heavy metal translocating P-type ATPase [Bifidobacterium sp. W8115]|uniref:heavy metal translocating P-type ATPase n=1 Tax=Bifidobacterium TaxID=1678 RepID=UPI0018DEAC0C|nr:MULTISPECIES: heavy metal translocating P-type ATPase [Bifidobacterium]MBI0072288.1 heavy metal translocating P-type ATPase [Bifidobacterium sp. W8112]MBI0125458.1 heavy metal translocating P-type ATPase [Bifidobacterium apousia]